MGFKLWHWDGYWILDVRFWILIKYTYEERGILNLKFRKLGIPEVNTVLG
jgi:hypothetical protein